MTKIRIADTISVILNMIPWIISTVRWWVQIYPNNKKIQSRDLNWWSALYVVDIVT